MNKYVLKVISISVLNTYYWRLISVSGVRCESLAFKSGDEALQDAIKFKKELNIDAKIIEQTETDAYKEDHKRNKIKTIKSTPAPTKVKKTKKV